MPSPSHAPVTSFAPPFGRKSTVMLLSPPIIAGSDMVAWNELLRNESEILPGYPWGPAALPMYGGLARSHPDHLHPSRPCTGRCRHEWLNLTVGLYWFGHKAPPSWERHHVPRAPACDL